ncbi:MAG: hypothetical protein LPK45_05165 [Bacteroidota bacterium]|nr:hypothetical protein [Bacteroidota bacterium]MDX5430450.1 hypothetical protein [Bacteroidota bacterium]MDX5469209.1 hypothetical protein [Bacteroidota bacterium]
MNRKVLLLVREVDKLNAQIEALLHFFSIKDKVVLAVYQPEDESDWPFRVYDLGWPVLKEPGLAKKLSGTPSLKKRPKSKWMESSTFLDLVVVHRSLYDSLKENSLISDILEHIHCPIFLMDEHQMRFDEIFLSYNGTGASFDSIKHFTYLFHPHFDDSSLNLLVKVNDKALNLENCVYDYLRLHKRHFAISRYFEEDYDKSVENLLDSSSSPLVVVGGDRHHNLALFSDYSSHRDHPSSMFVL